MAKLCERARTLCETHGGTMLLMVDNAEDGLGGADPGALPSLLAQVCMCK